MKAKIDELQLDYLILGHHYSTHEVGADYNGSLTTVEGIEKYTDEVVEGIKTGLYSYVCHPDLYMRGYPVWDEHAIRMGRKIISAANEADIPIEYNLLGFNHSKNDGKQGYPYPDFWLLAAKMGAKAIIGVDAHSPSAFLNAELFEEAKENLKKLRIETVEGIKFFR
jgi:histidinol-phosphatase (PHP family)